MLWLYSRGWYTEDIAETVGCTQIWVRKLAGRYNEAGPDAVVDNRRNNPGKERLLDEVGCAALRKSIENEVPAGGGQWNGPKVAEWMSTHLGRQIWPVRGWEYLRYRGYTPRRPRPSHEKATDVEAQRRYQSRPQAVHT